MTQHSQAKMMGVLTIRTARTYQIHGLTPTLKTPTPIPLTTNVIAWSVAPKLPFESCACVFGCSCGIWMEFQKKISENPGKTEKPTLFGHTVKRSAKNSESWI